MNRKTKYIMLTVALLTVLAAIVVTLGGRLGGEDEAEASASEDVTPEPENTGYVVEPEPEAPAPSPPSAPEAGGSLSAPSAPGPEGTPEPVQAANTHAVVVTAGPGGAVEPRGIVAVEDGGSLDFSFTPDAGFEISEVKVDGRAVSSPEGPPKGFTFINVRESHTVYVVFREIEAEPEPEPEETPEGGEDFSDREMTDDEHTENE